MLITDGSYLRTRWQLRVEHNASIADSVKNAQDAFLTSVKEYFVDDKNLDSLGSQNISMVIAHSNSISEESLATIFDNIWLLVGAILSMLLLYAIMLGDIGCKRGRPWLALVNLVVVVLALMTSFGIGFVFGFEVNSLVLIMVFLVMAVSFGNENFIIESINMTPMAKKKDQNKTDNEWSELEVRAQRFEKALKNSGLRITISTILKVAPFAACSIVQIPGVQAFCVFTALVLVAEYRYVSLLFCFHFYFCFCFCV